MSEQLRFQLCSNGLQADYRFWPWAAPSDAGNRRKDQLAVRVTPKRDQMALAELVGFERERKRSCCRACIVRSPSSHSFGATTKSSTEPGFIARGRHLERERERERTRRWGVLRWPWAGRLGGEATLLVKCPGLTISLGENRMSATVEVDATDRLKLGLS